MHSTRKSLAELGEKVELNERTAIEAAIAAVEKAMAGDDPADIETQAQQLAELSGKMAQTAYKDEGAGADAGEAAAGGKAKSGARADDNVVDADFEEVKDDK